jgi:kynureninase
VPITRQDCLALDAADPLALLRPLFDLDRVDSRGEIYLDGNSLGALPRATSARVRQVLQDEWSGGLIRSWNTAGWITLSARIGDKIARLIGAGPGEVAVADSTSLNLYKVLSAALAVAGRDGLRDRRILTERTNFPSDLYVADSLARQQGFAVVLADTEEVLPQLASSPAILLLTHVNYRTGRLHDMEAVTRAAHHAGTLVIWDLAHSAGVVPFSVSNAIDEDAAPDFAVGCGYKFLNGGPGAPAFLWAHPRHTAWMDRTGWSQPLAGWLGHAAPFGFAATYEPAAGVGRFHCGTPPIVSLAALESGVDTCLAAAPLGGVPRIREKSRALTSLFIDLLESRTVGHGLALVSPREADSRGSQVSVSHPSGGYAIVQALIARGVIGDFRAPDILRFGMAPLYTRFVDMWDAVDRLVQVLDSGEWKDPRLNVRAAVT